MSNIEEQQCVERLASSDPLEVCAALKLLGKLDICGANAITGIVKCCASSSIAVERTALLALASLGPRAQAQTLPLLKRLAERLLDAGCTYDCCGMDAFHGPIALYIEALCSIAANDSPTRIQELMEHMDMPADDIALIAELIADG